ncbi:unnamed protein product [Sympodiomycopsis kandeliae]
MRCSTLNRTPTTARRYNSTSASAGPQLTLALLKPTIVSYQPEVSAVMKEIKKRDLEIVRSTRLFWTPEQAATFYSEHQGKFYFPRLLAGMTSGPFMALALYGDDAITRWRQILGPTKVYKGKWQEQHPVGLRAIYGIGDTRNGFHGSDSPQTAQREIELIFPEWDTQKWLQDARQ